MGQSYMCRRCYDRGIVKIGFLRRGVETCPACNGDPRSLHPTPSTPSPPPPPPTCVPMPDEPRPKPDEGGMDLLTTVAAIAIISELAD